MEDFEKLKKDLGRLMPHLIKKYCEMEGGQIELVSKVDPIDAEVVTRILKDHCKTIHDMREFYSWLSQNPKWVYEYPYNQGFSMMHFWMFYQKNEKARILIYNIIQDIKLCGILEENEENT